MIRNSKDITLSDAVQSEGDRAGSVDYVASQLIRGVYEGQFVPGQKLIESDLRAKFDVGRGSIRETLRLLEAEGLVSTKFNRGARILSFTREEARDTLEINEHMIALAANLAAQRLDGSDDVQGLREILSKMKKSTSDVYALGQLRFEFMRELVRLTKNKQLYRHLPRYDAAVIRSQFKAATSDATISEDLEAFEAMIRHIVARDGDKAAEVARHYVRNWSRNVQALPDRYFDKR